MASPSNPVTGAPAAGSGAGEGQPSGQPTPAATGPTPAGSGQPSGGSPSPAVKEFKYTEDRSDWVPRHRLNEQSTKLTAAEQKAAQLEREIEIERNRIRALAGVNPKDPKAEEAAEVERVLGEILERRYPGIAVLQKLNPQQFAQILDQANSASSAATQYYDRQRDEMFGKVEGETAKSLGVEKLSERQAKQLRAAFGDAFRESYVKRERLAEQGRQNEIDENDFVGRYLRGDAALITEFVKDYLSDWVDSARRQVAQSTVRRQARPVPNGGRGETVVTKMPEVDYSDEKKFSEALLAARRSGA